MTSAISASSGASYSASSISPATSAARALRISTVCGNDPIVVVGSGGRCSRASWLARRCGRVAAVRAGRDDRVDAGPDLAVVQARVFLREAAAALEAAISSATASRPVVQGAARARRPRATFSGAERQPAAQRVVQVGLRLQRVRHVQGGARRRDRDRGRRTQQGAPACPARPPGRCARCCGRRRPRPPGSCRPARALRASAGSAAVHEVDADRLDGRAGQPRQRRAGVAEVGGDVDARAGWSPCPARCRRGLGQRGRVGADVGRPARARRAAPTGRRVGAAASSSSE